MLRSENTPMKKYTIKELAGDLFASLFAGAIVAFTLHVFANSNGFAPGGLTGIASVISQFTPNIKMSYWMLIFNIPLFILCSIFVEKKLGIFLTVYILTQSLTLLLLENINFYHYVATSGNVIFASIATGVLSGVGFSIQMKRHVASGGTYAISSLLKRKNPAAKRGKAAAEWKNALSPIPRSGNKTETLPCAYKVTKCNFTMTDLREN